jgi:hypothetical protein
VRSQLCNDAIEGALNRDRLFAAGTTSVPIAEQIGKGAVLLFTANDSHFA